MSNKETVSAKNPHSINQGRATGHGHSRPAGSASPLRPGADGMTTKSFSQMSQASLKGAGTKGGATLLVRVKEPSKRRAAKNGADTLSSRTREHTPTSQLTARSARPQDVVAFERTWNELLDTLENLQKRRVAALRTKLAQIVDSNVANLEGANATLERSLLGKDGDIGSAQQIAKLVKHGFAVDQERVIRELQSKLS